MLCPLCLLPLFADKLDCCRNKDVTVAAASEFETYILVIAHELEGAESFNIIVDSPHSPGIWRFPLLAICTC